MSYSQAVNAARRKKRKFSGIWQVLRRSKSPPFSVQIKKRQPREGAWRMDSAKAIGITIIGFHGSHAIQLNVDFKDRRSFPPTGEPNSLLFKLVLPD
jgi:hypothetical protein